MFTQKLSAIGGRLLLIVGLLLFLTASVSQAAVAYSTAVLADSPIGYWRLGETSGPTAFDQTANTLNGTYSGSVTLGQGGAIRSDDDKAVDFSGGRVTVADAPAFHAGTQALSVELWLTADSLASFSSPMMKTTSGSWNDGYGFFYDAGQLSFWVGSYLQSVGTSFSSGPEYHQIVGTYLGGQGGANNIRRIYVDGVLANEVFTSQASFTDSFGSLNIGTAFPGSGAVWDGKLDEVSIYSYTLSAAQIQDHFLDGIAVPEPSSVTLWLCGVAVIRWALRRRSR